MKTAVSLPDELFRRAERLAARLGIPRSRLYATAIAEYLERHRHDGVTEALDSVYHNEPSALDKDLGKAQHQVLDEDW